MGKKFYEKIYFETWINNQYNWLQNNIAQLYFILWRAKLCWNFSSCLRDATDIYRFPIVHMVKTHFLLENLWISEPSLGIMEKFQCSLTLPNIKYNCAVSFWSQLYWLFIYASKYIFPHKKKILTKIIQWKNSNVVWLSLI